MSGKMSGKKEKGRKKVRFVFVHRIILLTLRLEKEILKRPTKNTD